MASAPTTPPADGEKPAAPIRFTLGPDTAAVDALVLTVAGEVDFTTVAALLDAGRHALARSPSVLVIEASGIGFLDVGGYRALVKLSVAAAAQGCVLELRSPSYPVRRLLELLPTSALPTSS